MATPWPTTAPRLFVAPARLSPPQPVRLGGAEHHHLVRVLRLRLGDPVVLLDGTGRLVAARVARLGEDHSELACESETTAATSGPQLVLLAGLLKGDKQDFVIQKATELGASAIVPVVCQRSVPQLGEERAEKRQQRWARIAVAAAAQCRRPDVPQVAGPTPLAEALRPPTDSPATSLLLYEGVAPPLHTQLAAKACGAPAQVRLLIGPEGGFGESEVAAALLAGFAPCSLGPRVLRAETAVVAALAVLQYALAQRAA
jgi:16S rRNA (uracil1498-N3)-methyltransferase